MQSGKVVILGILGIALGAAGLAWWHQRQQGQQAMDFWGVENAFLLRHGADIALLKLSPPSEEAETPIAAEALRIDGKAWPVIDQRDLQQAKGISHARQALIFDASYDWTRPTTAPPLWQYAWQIRDERGQLCVLFDLESETIRNSENGRCASLKIARGFATFFDENLRH